MKYIKILIPILFISCYSVAQMPYTWKEYFSYNSVIQVTQIGDTVVGLSKNGLLFYSISANKTAKLTKINGLSTIGLNCMQYNKVSKLIIVGYNDGCIDLVHIPNLTVSKIPTIAKRSISGSKSINSICLSGDTAFFATNFGVVSLQCSTGEFLHTTILGTQGEYLPVHDISILQDTLYAATTIGLYRIALSKNISDAQLWEKVTYIPNPDKEISKLCNYNNSLLIAYKADSITHLDTIFSVENGVASEFPYQYKNIKNIEIKNSHLTIVSNNKIEIFNTSLESIFAFDSSNTNKSITFTDAYYINSDSIWVSDALSGLYSSKSGKSICPQGPLSNLISETFYKNNRLYIVCGDSKAYKEGIFSTLIGTTWYGHINWDIRNSICIYPIKNSESYYYGTGGWGLIQASNPWSYDSIYNSTNSPIRNIYSDASPYEIINDITMDSYSNLWIVNQGVDYPLIVKTKDNAWYSYSFEGLSDYKTVERIIVDRNGYKWITGDKKIIVFDENNTLSDSSDDLITYIQLSDSEGNIADRSTCIAEDIDGTIWIGTTQGIAIHSQSSQVFDTKKNISRIKIEIDGEVGYLLSTEKITVITVDGGNRKWIGTSNSGVFLISADGTSQIAHFTAENSPIPSNQITSISINQTTGEIFIGTDQGLVSFMGDAIIGSNSVSSLIISPNPIREDYSGNIFIKGTSAQAIIKITDMSGNLVNQLIANGGMGVWDGTNLYGNRVASGIYLIYVSDENGENTTVSKLLIVR